MNNNNLFDNHPYRIFDIGLPPDSCDPFYKSTMSS